MHPSIAGLQGGFEYLPTLQIENYNPWFGSPVTLAVDGYFAIRRGGCEGPIFWIAGNDGNGRARVGLALLILSENSIFPVAIRAYISIGP